MKRTLAIGASLVFILGVSRPSLGGQDPKSPKGAVSVDQAAVDKAIEKGLQYLKVSDSPRIFGGDSAEFKLLAFIEGGLPETDPAVQALLEECLDRPLEWTYKVAVLAMCLEAVDRVRYQRKIAQCGQFLLDNIKPSGAFSYGAPTEFDALHAMPRRGVASSAAKAAPPEAAGPKVKPEVKSKIKLVKRKEGPARIGDNSNSQYAALGIRACHEAGIVFPKAEIERCRQYWIASQHPAAAAAVKGRPATASGGGAEPRGWCYASGQLGTDCAFGGAAYASMTAGAIGAICIYDYILGKDWKKEKSVVDGLAWLDKNWSVTENVGPSETLSGKPTAWLYYSLYAVERTGMLFDSALIGNHDWYLEGARVLLNAQKADGSWGGSEYHAKHPQVPTWDTCFAILFLKRATRRLVITGK